MRRLLRFILILLGALCALILVEIGLSAQQPIFTDDLTASYIEEDSSTHLHLVDVGRGIHIDLTGSACDTSRPSSTVGGYPYNGSIGGYPYTHPAVLSEKGAFYIVHNPPFGTRCKLGQREAEWRRKEGMISDHPLRESYLVALLTRSRATKSG